MEKKLNAKIAIWFAGFKKDVATKIIESYDDAETVDASALVEYIYNYPHLNLTKQDLQKRTRVKNIVPFHQRCRA